MLKKVSRNNQIIAYILGNLIINEDGVTAFGTTHKSTIDIATILFPGSRLLEMEKEELGNLLFPLEEEQS